jgi:F0F1-type ATP synthase delta subunit
MNNFSSKSYGLLMELMAYDKALLMWDFLLSIKNENSFFSLYQKINSFSSFIQRFLNNIVQYEHATCWLRIYDECIRVLAKRLKYKTIFIESFRPFEDSDFLPCIRKALEKEKNHESGVINDDFLTQTNDLLEDFLKKNQNFHKITIDIKNYKIIINITVSKLLISGYRINYECFSKDYSGVNKIRKINKCIQQLYYENLQSGEIL